MTSNDARPLQSASFRLFAAICLLLSTPVAAPAGNIRCVYTEPFIDTTFKPRAGTVTISRAGAKMETFRVRMRGGIVKTQLSNGLRGFRQTMLMNGKGSDGMSDTVFPYSATLSLKGLSSRLNGGCR